MEVWSSPAHQWFTLAILAGFGVVLVLCVRRDRPKSWLGFVVGLVSLYLAYPKPIDRPLFDRPMLLAALRDDGVAMEWPVRRVVPYRLLHGASARSRKWTTYLDVELDPAAPEAGEFSKIHLSWSEASDAATFIAELERRSDVNVSITGPWLRHLVSEAWERQRK